MRRIKIKRPRRNNPHCSYHYGGHCQNPAHNHYGAYGFNMEEDVGNQTLMEQYADEATYEQTGTFRDEALVDVVTYSRNGQTLPFIKGGATDESVEKMSQIKGLVSELQKRMGISTITGKISTSQIKAYQKAQGLSDDGVIGKDSYTKLGFSAPFPKSSSGGSTYDPNKDADLAVGTTIMDKVWFYPAVGIGGLGLLVILLKMLKGKKKKKSSQMRMNRW